MKFGGAEGLRIGLFRVAVGLVVVVVALGVAFGEAVGSLFIVGEVSFISLSIKCETGNQNHCNKCKSNYSFSFFC